MPNLNVNEKEIIHDIKFNISNYNANGAFFPSSYQKIAVNMIEEHLDLLGMGEKAMMRNFGVSWVLLSTSLKLYRRLSPDDKLSGTTWNSGGRGPVFRRDLEFRAENGEIVAHGVTYSTLISQKTRKICTDRAVIAAIELPQGERILKADRKFAETVDFLPVEELTVRPSMTDGVGHVNNTRYGEFVYDALSASERAAVGDLASLDVWFISELREGERLYIEKAYPREGVTAVRGKKDNGDTSFVMRLGFGITQNDA